MCAAVLQGEQRGGTRSVGLPRGQRGPPGSRGTGGRRGIRPRCAAEPRASQPRHRRLQPRALQPCRPRVHGAAGAARLRGHITASRPRTPSTGYRPRGAARVPGAGTEPPAASRWRRWCPAELLRQPFFLQLRASRCRRGGRRAF